MAAKRKRKRRGRTTRGGAKRYAFEKETRKRVFADEASDKKDLYEYGFRPVARRVFPKRTKNGVTKQKKGYYFYYLKANGEQAPTSRGRMTPTHALMQSIICDTLLCRSSLEGSYFSTDLDTAEPEKVNFKNISESRGTTRPDITGTSKGEPSFGLAAGALDIEIAVTNPVKGEDRYHDLALSRRPCLEILVPRDETLETNDHLDELEDILRAALDAGTLLARWIVEPSGKQIVVKQLSQLQKQTMDQIDQCMQSRSRILSKSLENTAEDIPDISAEIEAATHELNEYDKSVEALCTALEQTMKGPEVGFVRRVLESLFASLRESRLKYKRDQIAEAKSALMKEYGIPRRGLTKYIAALTSEQRSLLKRRDEQALAAQQQHMLAQMHVSKIDRELAELRAQLEKLRRLAERGVETIPVFPDREVVDAIDYEFERWCR